MKQGGALLGLVMLSVTFAPACGGGSGAKSVVEDDDPCFSAGEPCGVGFCSQVAYCNDDHQCVTKLQDGSACTDPKQCTGAQCDANRCAGGPVVCRD
jgi:hypothetical protein